MKNHIETLKIEELFSIKDKIVLITGGGGLGLKLAEAYAVNGAKVILTHSTVKKIAQTKEIMQEKGVSLDVIAMDQTKKEEVDETVAAIAEKYGHIDALINTAGIAPWGDTEDFDTKLLHDIMEVNVIGTVYVDEAVGRSMIAWQKEHPDFNGKIVNVGSMAGVVCHSYTSMPYQASKAAVHSLTRSFATCWAKYNINVNTLSPTWMMTPMLDGSEQEYYDAVNRVHAFGRMADVDEMVGAAIYLTSDASNYVTGHQLLVDGGFSCMKPLEY